MVALASVLPASANFQFTDFDAASRTCTLLGYDGSRNVTALVLPDVTTRDGIEYKVTEIASGAVCDLPKVKKITIGKNVSKIGGAIIKKEGKEITVTGGSARNFTGCPALERFAVAAGSEYFYASAEGVLMFTGTRTIVRVPQAMACPNATFNLTKEMDGACDDAFAENSTIKTINLSPSYDSGLHGDGFNDMVNLESFGINGSETPKYVSVVNGVLLNKDKTIVISFPPKKQAMSYDCPLTVTEIGWKAFANTNLYQVNMPYVSKIDGYAFYNSGITSAELSNKITEIGVKAFMKARRITKITINSCITIPRDFARECPQLTTVNLPNKAKSVGETAFKDCPKLASFPFDASIDFYSDSIFSGCGFKEVKFTGKYGVTVNGAYRFGGDMFNDNKSLESLDLTAMTPSVDGAFVSLPQGFVAACPLLKKVWLCDNVYFNNDTTYGGVFSDNPACMELVLGSFRLTRGFPVFRYDYGNNYPVLYMRTTDAAISHWNLHDFFSATGRGTCTPTIYCDGYDMKESDMATGSYIYPGAKYYIPGGTDNYADAVGVAQSVTAMYDISTYNDDKKGFTVALKKNISYITFTGVVINGMTFAPIPDNGIVGSGFTPEEVKSLELKYSVDNVPMHTIYPLTSAGVDDIISDAAAMEIAVNGNAVTFSTEARYAITDTMGRTIASGTAGSADLSALVHGLYIVTATALDGRSHATKKLIR